MPSERISTDVLETVRMNLERFKNYMEVLDKYTPQVLSTYSE